MSRFVVGIAIALSKEPGKWEQLADAARQYYRIATWETELRRPNVPNQEAA